MIDIPPSIIISCPVIDLVSSSSNVFTVNAISLGEIIFLSGVLDFKKFIYFKVKFFLVIFVSTYPGEMAFTVIPLGPNSTAKFRVKPSKACFDIE